MKTKAVNYLNQEYGPLTFARAIASIRKCEDWTLQQMSYKLKISTSTLSKLEKGQSIPSVQKAYEVAKKLGLNKEVFVRLAINDHFKKYKINLELISKGLKKTVISL